MGLLSHRPGVQEEQEGRGFWVTGYCPPRQCSLARRGGLLSLGASRQGHVEGRV
ncbi:hypothetical protein DEO72_LG10g3082 [Vigna unguiculata]|uniref:Uncharacterized protein n=1 Tax=Vigna unguiculata TaxID=3917 RepID=A0A4D6NGN0_VIGUN|nr:hypothetical protein DEO72_LG10g3082 [Vigna unguiculata]